MKVNHLILKLHFSVLALLIGCFTAAIAADDVAARSYPEDFVPGDK